MDLSTDEINTNLQPERIIIDNRGDVLVEAGSKRILVSSKILSMASSVFDAMLNSRFAEGVATRSAADPLNLPVPEDDPEALEVLLHVLYFSCKRTYPELDIDTQLNVARLTDKYDCCTTVHGDGGRWL